MKAKKFPYGKKPKEEGKAHEKTESKAVEKKEDKMPMGKKKGCK